MIMNVIFIHEFLMMKDNRVINKIVRETPLRHTPLRHRICDGVEGKFNNYMLNVKARFIVVVSIQL